MSKIIDVYPNVIYELDNMKLNPINLETWKHLVKGYKTPFRKFSVRIEAGIDEIDNDELLKFIDEKYKELDWKYFKISEEEKKSIEWHDIDYVEIVDLKKYKAQEILNK